MLFTLLVILDERSIAKTKTTTVADAFSHPEHSEHGQKNKQNQFTQNMFLV